MGIVDKYYNVITPLSSDDNYSKVLNCLDTKLPSLGYRTVNVTTSAGYVTGGGKYAVGSKCILTAYPPVGCTFERWSDGNKSNPREFDVASGAGDINLKAEISGRYCKVTLLGVNGKVSANRGTAAASVEVKVLYGSSCSIAFTADSGYVFSQWSDGIGSASRTLTSVTSDITLTATANKSDCVVTVSCKESEGTVTGGGTKAYGEEVSVEFTPVEGLTLDYWTKNGVNTTSDNPYYFRVTGDTALVAYSKTKPCVVSVERESTIGEVIGEGIYNYGDKVSLEFVESGAVGFGKWTTVVEGETVEIESNPYVFTIHDDVVFTLETSVAKYTVSAYDSHAAFEGTGEYEYGTQVTTLRCLPRGGYRFIKWSDGDKNQTHLPFTVTGDMEFTVVVEEYSVTIEAVTEDPTKFSVLGAGKYGYGEIVVLNFIHTPDYELEGWYNQMNEKLSGSNPYSFPAEEDLKLIARAKPASYEVEAEVSPEGSGLVLGTGTYAYGSTAKLTFKEASGYEFDQWSDGSKANPYTLKVDGPIKIVGNAHPKVCKISTAGVNGQVIGGGEYDYGSKAKLTFIPDDKYAWGNWNDGNTDNPREVEVKGHATYIGYAAADTYEIKAVVTTPNTGKVEGTGFYAYGAQCTLTFVPAKGYKLSEWADGYRSESRTFTVTGPETFYVDGEVAYYTVSVDVEEGIGTVSGVQGKFMYGTKCKLIFTPESTQIPQWWSDGELKQSGGNEYSFTVTKNTSIQVFESVVVKLRVYTTNGNVSVLDTNISPAKDITFNAVPGNMVTVRYEKIKGYELSAWKEGTTPKSSNEQYTFEVPSRDMTLFAEESRTQVQITTTGEHCTVSGGGYKYYGDEVTLNVTPESGYRWGYWDDDKKLPQERVFKAEESKTYKAVCVPQGCYVNLTNEHGVVEGLNNPYEYEAECTLVCVSDNYGYEFKEWKVNDVVVTSERTLTFTVRSDTDVEAVYTPINYELTLTAVHCHVEVTYAGETHTGSGVYPYGASLKLKAVVDSGYTFVSWSDKVASEERTLTIEGPASLTATAAEQMFEVAVKAYNGKVTGNGRYAAGAVATLEFFPSTGYHFEKWSDESEDMPRYEIVTHDIKDLSVTGVKDGYIVTATGEHCTITGAGKYKYGVECTLRCVADAGYRCYGWKVAGVTVTDKPEYTFKVTNDVELVADVRLLKYYVTVEAPVELTVTGRQEEYSPGATCTLTATPTAGYGWHFVNWNNNPTLTDPTLSFVVNGDTKVIAVGEPNLNTVRITNAHGTLRVIGRESGIDETVHGDYENTAWPSGTRLNVTVTEDEGYTFTAWSGSYVAANKSIDIPVAGDIALTANYLVKTLDVTFVSNPSTYGKILVNGKEVTGGTYAYGTVLQLKAVANAGYAFSLWSDNNIYEERSWVVNTNEIWANFKVYTPEMVSVVLTTETPEAVASFTGAGDYAIGASCTVECVPESGYTFLYWNSELYKDNPWTFPVTGNTRLNAVLAVDVEEYEIKSTGTNGVVIGAGTYVVGETCTLEFIPDADYEFSGWADGYDKNPRVFTVTGPAEYNCVGTPQKHRLTLVAGTEGVDYFRKPGSGAYPTGTVVLFSCVPKSGYIFDHWNDGDDFQVKEIIMPAYDVTYTAYLHRETFTLSLDGEHCSFLVDGQPYTSLMTIPSGTDVAVECVPDEGFEFIKWGDNDINNPRTINMHSPWSLYTACRKIMYTIDVRTNGHATTSGSGSYEYGTSIVISCIPEIDPQEIHEYEFVKWDDGTSGSVRTITVTESKTYIGYTKETHTDNCKLILTRSSEAMTMLEKVTVSFSGGPTRDYNWETDPSATHTIGEEVVMTAVPLPGYDFVQWGDGDINNPRTLYLYYDTPLTPVLEEHVDAHKLFMTVSGGTVCYKIEDATSWTQMDESNEILVPTSTVPSYPTVVTLQFIPARGSFAGWTVVGDRTYYANPLTLTPTSNLSIIAGVVQGGYIIDVKTEDAHSDVLVKNLLSGEKGLSLNIIEGDQFVLECSPYTSLGYMFSHWTDDLGNEYMQNPISLKAERDEVFTAHCVQDPDMNYLSMYCLSGGYIAWEETDLENPVSLYYAVLPEGASPSESDWIAFIDSIDVQEGDYVYFKGINESISTGVQHWARFDICVFDGVELRGSVMSLLDGGAGTMTEITVPYAFYKLFYDNVDIKDASMLRLPATVIGEHCYDSMLAQCTDMRVGPPELPALDLSSSESCYQSMFAGSNVEAIAHIRAKSIGASSCRQMYYQCTNLVETVTLDAEDIGSYGCYQMFSGCTNLRRAVILASTLAPHALEEMFANSTSFKYITTGLKYITATDCTLNWCLNVYQSFTSMGKFVGLISAGWDTGASGIPYTWAISLRDDEGQL